MLKVITPNSKCYIIKFFLQWWDDVLWQNVNIEQLRGHENEQIADLKKWTAEYNRRPKKLTLRSFFCIEKIKKYLAKFMLENLIFSLFLLAVCLKKINGIHEHFFQR